MGATISVQLPDGTTVNDIPSGTTKAQLFSKLRTSDPELFKRNLDIEPTLQQYIPTEELEKMAAGRPIEPGSIQAGESIPHYLGRSALNFGEGLLTAVPRMGEAAAHSLDPTNPNGFYAHPGLSLKTAAGALNPIGPIVEGVREGNPVQAGLSAGLLAAGAKSPVEGLTERIPSATDVVINHPALMRTLSTGGGLLAGHAVEGAGGDLGEFGGAYGGYRIGGDILRSYQNKAIQQVLEGERNPNDLPPHLWPQLRNQWNAQSDIAAHIAAETGQPLDTLRIPSAIKDTTERKYEEKLKMRPNFPPLVQTPEQIAESAQNARNMEIQTQELHGAARRSGMAHAAESHTGEFVPSRRSTTNTTARSYKLLNRLPHKP